MNNAVTQTPPKNFSPIQARENEIKHGLMGVRRQIESLLADKSKSDRFMAAALVVAQDKTLAGCNVPSIVNALVGVAMSDLNIDKNIGQCHLVKYGNDVQLMIGYRGFIQLLFRAGWLIKALPVYKTDHFKISFDGWDNRIEFEPDIDNRDEGDKDWVYENLRGVYVVARHSETQDEYSDFVPKAIIEKLRKISPNQKVNQYTKPEDKKRLDAGLPIGVWYDFFAEMAKAKAVKKLSKLLPIGDRRIQATIAADDKTEIGDKVNYSKTAENGVIDIEPTSSTTTDNVEDKLNAAMTAKPTTTPEAKPDPKPEPKKRAVSDETDWMQMNNDDEDDEVLAAVMNSIPDEKLSNIFDQITTVELLTKCYGALNTEKQEKFADCYATALDFLSRKG